MSKSATVSLELDSNLTFTNAAPSPSKVSQDTIEWTIEDLKAGESRIIMFGNNVANEPDGTMMISEATITPKASDRTPSNNTDTLVQWITSSSGKRQVASTLNDKITSPRRKMKDGMSANYTRIDEKLEYTVRFQNTSNNEASQVIIKDTLDMAIDVSTFELMAASHEVDFDIEGKGIITFTFEDMNLPASDKNELGSKGFVKYSVEAKDDVQDETKVHNNAGIYFDYDKSIVTNITQNTMVKKLPSSTSTIIESANAENITGYITPNPFNESFEVRVDGEDISDYTFELYNMMGKKIKHKGVTDSKTVNVKAGDLSSGMYLYTIKLNDGRQSSGKIIAK